MLDKSETEMNNKFLIIFISAYKLVINFLRIIAGSLLLYFGCNIKKTAMFLLHKELLEDPADLFSIFITAHIREATFFSTCVLAISLIVLSVLELFFIFVTLERIRWGAVGFLILAILWVPIEIFFVNKFLNLTSMLNLIVNFLIILFFLRLLIKSKSYFKK